MYVSDVNVTERNDSIDFSNELPPDHFLHLCFQSCVISFIYKYKQKQQLKYVHPQDSTEKLWKII